MFIYVNNIQIYIFFITYDSIPLFLKISIENTNDIDRLLFHINIIPLPEPVWVITGIAALDFKVQMVARTVAGRAHSCNKLALLYLLTVSDKQR